MTAQPIEDDDPFADALIQRDQYQRPYIIPVDGGEPIPYTRASTFASELDNGSGLSIWKVRTAALGVARYPDIAAEVASLRYVEPGDRPPKGSVDELTIAWKQKCRDIKADKAKLDELVDLAQHRVDDRASHGTSVHAFTDPDPSPFVPPRMEADVASYHAKLAELGIVQLLSEQFVVNDELQVAGTFDGTYRVPFALLLAAYEAGHLPGFDPTDANEVCGGDKKTGSIHGQAVAIQTATYFRGGKLYTPNLDGTATRTEHGARQDVAILIHIPKGKGVTEVYPISLVTGWADALLAVQVREADAHNKIAPAFPIAAPAPAAPVAEAVAEAKPKRKRRTKAEMAAARAAEAPQTEAPSSGVGPLGDLIFEPDEPTVVDETHILTAEQMAEVASTVAALQIPEGMVFTSTATEIASVTEPLATVSEPVATEAPTIATAADRIIGEVKAERSITAELAANEAAIKARLDAERAATPARSGFVSSPERDQALANAAANLKAQTVAPSMQEQIASAPTLDYLLALHGEHGATWTDDDKSLATGRRNLLLGGIATTAVTA